MAEEQLAWISKPWIALYHAHVLHLACQALAFDVVRILWSWLQTHALWALAWDI